MGGENLTEYFASMLREKSAHKKIITPIHLNYSFKDFNFETKEKHFELRYEKISESIEHFFENQVARNAKEKAIHFISTPNDQSQIPENCFELPDGEKVTFESSFNFDRNYFDKKENNPQSVELQSLVFESLNACDVDIRKNVIANIIMTGDNSLISTFKESFEEILNNFVIGNTKAKLSTPGKSSDRKLFGWTGGSILSSTGVFSEYVDPQGRIRRNRRIGPIQKMS